MKQWLDQVWEFFVRAGELRARNSPYRDFWDR